MTRKQINKYIRSISKHDKENCTCEICNSNENIQEHHLIKVKDLSDIAWMNGYREKEEIKNMYIPTAFLCDKCHETMHQLLNDNYQEEMLDLDYIAGFVDLLSRIDLSNVDEQLYYQYSDKVDDMLHMVVYNFIQYGNLNEDELNTMQEIISLGLGEEYEEEFYK